MGHSKQSTLEKLGYSDVPHALHRATEAVARQHAYALEMRKVFTAQPLLPTHASILGVYEVDGVPAVCLVSAEPGCDLFEGLRNRLWNQGLISLILLIGEDQVQALSTLPDMEPAWPVSIDSLDRASPYSAYGVRSGALKHAHASWFSSESRIDRYLLNNLGTAIDRLCQGHAKFSQTDAQHLVGQTMFVRYLQDRQLISKAFLDAGGLGHFNDLLSASNGKGMDALLSALKARFNGDFLSPDATRAKWATYPDEVFETLRRFLNREDLPSGQRSIWGYDFSYIPVELLSGIYETFLGDRKREDAAYYTPVHLANLAVDELFRDVERPDQEIIWDGACGSGILLTTAFRRMLGAAEKAQGKRLSFAERSKLLTSRVYGGDINISACRVTAFSLYLCLLEDLPKGARSEIRLPHLLDVNIFTSNSYGDAFGLDDFVGANIPTPTCVISNPPWKEPKGSKTNSADVWAKDRGVKTALRQIALTYAHMTSVRAAPGARIVLILPGGMFLRERPHKSIQEWLRRVKIERLINFSDLRHLLFPGAKHPCVLAVVRNEPHRSLKPHWFDYVTPKADVGLHYNRLTIYSADHRRMNQGRVQVDAAALRSLYWCSELEVADIEKMRLLGTLGDLVERGDFLSGTGFHVTDNAKEEAVRPGYLARMNHIATTALPRFGPALSDVSIDKWPKHYEKIASQGRRELYEGPRVIVPNGMTADHRIRAFATDVDASVNNSCSVLKPVDGNHATASILAVYLSSRLAAYLAMVLAPSAVTERTQIKHGELLHLPFILPGEHPDQALAAELSARTAAFVASGQAFSLVGNGNDLPAELEDLIRRYFGVPKTLEAIIDEVVEVVLPNMQPTTLTNIPGPLQNSPTSIQMERYASALSAELGASRDSLEGTGSFDVSLQTWQTGDAGGMGLVRVEVKHAKQDTSRVEEVVLNEVLTTLQVSGLLDGVTSGGLSLKSDLLFRQGNAICFAKPMVNRLWLTSAALDDALRIVRHVQEAP
ncbi:N-6 DNA methylase [Xanthomonas campestris pv. raphani]|uniref:N-6 DNA methylase n=1 Tax=Xanthomonas campestris TaxID=339 RepID=UPI002B226298|nr:N-6 DNA methylase [Xanthomonas campestris]MEA9770776.1 N-6 DNA methylase [Xanthomonas campestris pv. raphani]MEA9799325.1 N-6 DNA methylase [Xanthomonas campestris pv. raphani]